MISSDFSSLKSNYHNILQKIQNSRNQRSAEARKLAPPQLIAVSKLQPVEKIHALLSFGQKVFGENYVQEFSEKHEALSQQSLVWHFIGHLQSNKIKEVAGKCELIHSLDSIKTIEKLDSFCREKKLPPQKILLQVKSGAEETKSGLEAEEIPALISRIQKLKHIKISGLMTLPPLQSEPEDNRIYFKKLRELLFEINNTLPAEQHLSELSMGTSHDYSVAVEEGATFVRVGTELFGERPIKKENNFHG